MATISSHVLDSVVGDHARGIRVACVRINADQSRQLIFDVLADNEGRISQNVDVELNENAASGTGSSSDASAGANAGTTDSTAGIRYELEFYSADYFAGMQLPADGGQIMDTVVVRISLPDPATRYHLPLMVSPHSYTVWWSGVAPNSDAQLKHS